VLRGGGARMPRPALRRLAAREAWTGCPWRWLCWLWRWRARRLVCLWDAWWVAVVCGRVRTGASWPIDECRSRVRWSESNRWAGRWAFR
jgi:hypothetical protein